MTPTPRPTIDWWDIGIPIDAIGIAEVFFLFLIIMGTAAILVWALVRSSRSPAPSMLVTALAILTLVSIVIFALTREQVLATIAATGLGALAGAVSTTFNNDQRGGKHAMEAPTPNVDFPDLNQDTTEDNAPTTPVEYPDGRETP